MRTGFRHLVAEYGKRAVMLWLVVAAAVGASAEPTFKIVAQTGQNGILSIGQNVSINDSGLVAFAGKTPSGISVFVGDGTKPPWVVAGIPTSAGTDPPFQINNAGKVIVERGPFPPVTSDPVIDNVPIIGPVLVTPGMSDTYSFLQLYDAFDQSRMDLIAQADWQILDYLNYLTYDKIGPFSYLGPAVSVNNFGSAVFIADTGEGFNSAYVLATPRTGGGFNTNTTWLGAQPMIADNGQIVVRNGPNPTDSVVLYPQDLSKPTLIAASAWGFTALGAAPGISDDGQYVAFYGDLSSAGAARLNTTSGPGIFLARLVGGISRILRITGTDAPDGTPLFSAFDGNRRVGIQLHKPTTYVLANGGVAIVFAAKDIDGKDGLWYSVFDPVSRRVHKPAKVVQQGDTIGSAGVVQSIDFLDPLNMQGQIAFVAETDRNTMVVRADPAENYLLAVGVNYPLEVDANLNFINLEGGYGAAQVVQSFQNFLSVERTHLVQLDSTQPRNISTLSNHIAQISSKVRAGDTFVFYFNSHAAFLPWGGSEPPVVVQGEGGKSTTETSDPALSLAGNDLSGAVSPALLASWFDKPEWAKVHKLFIIDCCYAGGFGVKGEANDLLGLPNSTVLAACPETTTSECVATNDDLWEWGLLGHAVVSSLDRVGDISALGFKDFADLVNIAGQQFAGTTGYFEDNTNAWDAFWGVPQVAEWNPVLTSSDDPSAGFASGGGKVASAASIDIIHLEPGHSVTVTFSGTPNQRYLVQVTTNLAPSSVWTTVSTNVAGSDGSWMYTEPVLRAPSCRFYRSVMP